MKYSIIIVHILIVCVLSSDVANSTEGKADTAELKNSIFPDLQGISITTKDEVKDESCRDVSLHKCGSSMVRVFRLLDFLPTGKSLDAKCTLRKAFFSCLKTDKEPCKKRRWSIYHSSAFRKKLVRSLWSTRRCVFGLKPEENEV